MIGTFHSRSKSSSNLDGLRCGRRTSECNGELFFLSKKVSRGFNYSDTAAAAAAADGRTGECGRGTDGDRSMFPKTSAAES